VSLAFLFLDTGSLRGGGEDCSVTKAEIKKVVESNNRFALDLYKRVSRQTKGNLVISPFSISTALAMVYAGAGGETAEEMARVLHFPLEQEKVSRAFGGLLRDLSPQVSSANVLWHGREVPLRQSFRRTVEQDFRAEVHEIDFANRVAAAERINHWVEDKTRGKIAQLLKAQDLDPRVPLFLANAIHFKDKWEVPFPKEATKDREFETDSGEKILVPMMALAGRSSRAAPGTQWGRCSGGLGKRNHGPAARR
jgi:serpin B